MASNKIVYWEERTVNVGQFESFKCGLNYSFTVDPINEIENAVKIKEMSYETLKSDDAEAFKEAIKLVQGRVRKVLNAREADIRMRAEQFVDSHSPTGKALLFKLIDAVRYRKKAEQIDADKKDIEDLENSISEDDDSVFDK